MPDGPTDGQCHPSSRAAARVTKNWFCGLKEKRMTRWWKDLEIKGDQMEWRDTHKRQIRYGSRGYWCNIFQRTKWKQQAMFEPCVSWRETSISMDVCCEAKRKLLCQTTYPAVGVQSSEDYWNANVNDSGRRQSFSRRHNVTGWMRLSRIKPNSRARCDVGTIFLEGSQISPGYRHRATFAQVRRGWMWIS